MKQSIILPTVFFVIILCHTANLRAFCPVSFFPGALTCEGQIEFKWTSPNYPGDIVNPNSQKNVNISGGCPPYSWSVSGEGYWLEDDLTYDLVNTVYTDSAIDCISSITVVDKYGNRVTGNLRSSGRWVRIGSRCDFPGPATKRLGYDSWYKWQYERVVGKYRQYQTYSTSGGFGGTCLWTEPPCGNQKYSCIPQSNPGSECITLESTGLIDDYDQNEFPCIWQSPEMSEEEFGGYHTYCTDLGAKGWTSMLCMASGLLKLEEWRCD
jgi:hypothetical protein